MRKLKRKREKFPTDAYGSNLDSIKNLTNEILCDIMK